MWNGQQENEGNERKKENAYKMEYSKLHNCKGGFITQVITELLQKNDFSKQQFLKQLRLDNTQKQIIKPVINEAIDAFVPEHPSILVVIVVISPAEDHQAFRLGFCNAVHVA